VLNGELSITESEETSRRRRSEFRASAVEGIRLWNEGLVCDFTCALVTVMFEVKMRL
jgi:hypothetical protein